jgi:O-succinylbenzoic acid--CoA ligase
VEINSYEEILVKGPTVSPGAVSPDGWLHTGDLGALDERGRLRVTGRRADTIVSGGENVAPAEVEAVLEAFPAVMEAAVLGRSDPQWGEAVTAIVLARPGEELEIEQLRAHCARALAPYKVPKRFVLAAEPLPRTRSGKLLRRELR